MCGPVQIDLQVCEPHVRPSSLEERVCSGSREGAGWAGGTLSLGKPAILPMMQNQGQSAIQYGLLHTREACKPHLHAGGGGAAHSVYVFHR